jgi:hypothetical protein
MVLCKVISSHDKTKKGYNCDDFLDFELILPEYNKPKWDKGDEVCLKIYEEKGLTKKGKVKSKIMKKLNSWIKNNELTILKYFAANAELHNYKKVKGDCNNSYQEVKGNCYNSSQKVKGDCNNSYQEVKGNCSNYSQKVEGNCYNSSQKVKGNCYNSFQEVKGDCNNSSQKVEGNCYNSSQKVKGNCNNSSQKVKGDCNNSSQKVKGNCYNSSQKVKGDCNNSYQEVKGEIYLQYIRNNDKTTDDFIKMLSDKNNGILTWKELVKLAIKGYSK